jgi:hypothetical protein
VEDHIEHQQQVLQILKDNLTMAQNRMKQQADQHRSERSFEVSELLHTHLGFVFPKVIPCLLVIISHYPVSYILGENIPPGEYSLSVDTSV